MGRTAVKKKNVGKELYITIPYEKDDNSVNFTVISNSQGTVSTLNSGSLTNVSVDVNGSTVTTPFNIAVGDVVTVSFDPAGSAGNVELNGTY